MGRGGYTTTGTITFRYKNILPSHWSNIFVTSFLSFENLTLEKKHRKRDRGDELFHLYTIVVSIFKIFLGIVQTVWEVAYPPFT